MLELQVERELRMKSIDRLVVATSRDPADDPIQKLCQRLGVGCYRGSANDVLDRFYGVAADLLTDQRVRMTADCPLTDPAINDAVVEFYLAGKYDYVSNALEPSYPRMAWMLRCSLENAW